MSDEEQPPRAEIKSEADQTLMGVAPPRIDSATDNHVPHAPVLVRAGTSVADVESPSRVMSPLKPMASGGASEMPVAMPVKGSSGIAAFSEPVLRVARRRPVLWMVAAPLLFALFVLLIGRHGNSQRAASPATSAASASAAASALPAPSETATATISELESKPAGSLSARELVVLAEAHSDEQRAAARALRRKIEADHALGKDPAVQADLIRMAADERTARDALAGMAASDGPVGADLLYETWTRTPQRSEVTDLARSLVYSSEVRPSASPALAVALALRAAESCEQYQAALPNALKDGDRRSLHLLLKLNAKHGCGPKKAADCYACLREQKDELSATINAVKTRKPPSYAAAE